MNKLVIVFLLAVVVSSCGQKSKDSSAVSTDIIKMGENTPEPKFDFKESVWDFGKIKEGEKVEHTFKFTNVGKEDLVISKVTASCGCTIPDWSREPIKPGKEGKIKVSFDSKGKSNFVSKEITIFANTNPVTSSLEIKVFVEPS
jgi:hypothetical protein